MTNTERSQKLLLAWYDAHARALPWRGIHDPYRTWVSETMLQQTRVETVLGYYERFLARFPTVEALAAAPLDDVLKLWEGLGYYSRARNLHKGAQQVVNEQGGVIPREASVLRKLSGVGPYTAGAIASIAYDQPVPAVDGNVIRVVSRLCGIRENVGVPSVRRRLEAAAAELVPEQRPGDFNQAMMDLGATICVPGTPSCEKCPLRSLCDAYAAGDAEDLPQLPRKNPPKQLYYDVCIILSGDRVLMRQRTETMLNGLWVYPMLEGNSTAKQLPRAVKRLTALRVSEAEAAGEARHVFTHQVWNMRLWVMHAAKDAQAAEGWRFVTLAEMEQLAIPTAVRAARKAAAERLELV
ncbi:MAG: A/G-specific adenine glycosylase [Clostridia bacterium]|nr:A/G-specific adenine glycosylase [Clostridia bacterium]